MLKTECSNCGKEINARESQSISKFALCPFCNRFTPINGNAKTRKFRKEIENEIKNKR